MKTMLPLADGLGHIAGVMALGVITAIILYKKSQKI